jgi:3-isopropylmalate dehydrogenase
MCLNYSMYAPLAADLLTQSVGRVLAQGLRTADIAATGEQSVSGSAMTDAILVALDELAAEPQRMMKA